MVYYQYMNQSIALEQIARIERELQEIKVCLLLENENQYKTRGIYRERDITSAIRKARKARWHETYSKQRNPSR